MPSLRRRGQVRAAAADTSISAFYAGQSKSGLTGGLRGDIEYMLTPQLRIGGALRIDQAADWSETRKLAVIHVFSWLESSSEWMDGGTSYRDDSRGRKIYLGDQLRVGDQWREAMSTWREKVRKSARGSGGVYMAIDDRTNVGDFFHWLITEAAS